MANVDRPNGFTPAKTRSGAPITGLVRQVGVADGTDIFIGDALTTSSGLATPSSAAADTIIGVAVGFGKKDSGTQYWGGAFNPDDQTTLYYDDSASTHTEWAVYYVPAEDVLFEAQFDGTPTTPTVGQGYGLTYTTGNTATGRSQQEIDGDDVTDIDVVVVELPQGPKNDTSAAYGRVLVMFDDLLFVNLIS